MIASYGIACSQVRLSHPRQEQTKLTIFFPKVHHYFTGYPHDPLRLKVFVACLWCVMSTAPSQTCSENQNRVLDTTHAIVGAFVGS